MVHASSFGSWYSGNFVASLRALEEALGSDGWRLVYVLPDSARQRPWFAELTGSARVHVVKRHKRRLATAVSLARIAQHENAVILHTHFSDLDVAASIARVLLKLRGQDVRLVWHYHSPYEPDPPFPRRLKDLLKLRLFGAGAYVLAVTEEIRDDVVSRGFDARRAGWLLNGVDLTRPVSPTCSRDELRRQLGVASPTAAALLFGWDPFRKGVDVAVDAVQKLASDGRDIALVVVGEAPTRDFLLTHCGGSIPEFVKLVAPRECVADLYSAADLFLSISRTEGMTYSVGEAMAASLPVIVSDIPGQDWMRGGDGVVRVSCGDVDAVAAAVENLLRMPAEELDKRRMANREASAEISIQRWAERVREFYERVVSGAEVSGS